MRTYSDLDDDQLQAIQFILSGEDSMLCADVGTGKTVISLTAAQRLLAKGGVRRWLVLAPLLVATDTWGQEQDEWQHLQDLRIAIACGDAKQRDAALASEANIVVLNYENLSWLLDKYPRKGTGKALPFDGLICDEIDKLKNVSSGRFKHFRHYIKEFNHRIGLTGTIIPRDIQDVWGAVYMVDGGQTFGRSFYKWRSEYFYPTDYNQYNWRPFPDTRDKLVAALDGLVYRLKEKGMPELVLNPPVRVDMPTPVREKYEQMLKHKVVELDDDQIVEAVSEGVASGKLRQLATGFLYVDPAECPHCGGRVVKEKKRPRWVCTHCKKAAPPTTTWLTPVKLAAVCERVLQLEASGEQVILVYHFKAELEHYKALLPGMRYLGGGVTDKQKTETLRLWNSGELRILGLHPESASHGLNLQKTGARHFVFSSKPWTGGGFRQIVGRLRRRGQAAEQIFVDSFEYEGSIDTRIADVVSERLLTLDDFHEAFE